jgi:hypothetical protein
MLTIISIAALMTESIFQLIMNLLVELIGIAVLRYTIE